MLGVLDFAVFDEANGTEEKIRSAVPQALLSVYSSDAGRPGKIFLIRLTILLEHRS